MPHDIGTNDSLD